MAEPKDPQVNRQKGHPNSQHADFYSSHRETEEIAPHQGGQAGGEDLPVQKVTDRTGGAKTDSYFKKRDYE